MKMVGEKIFPVGLAIWLALTLLPVCPLAAGTTDGTRVALAAGGMLKQLPESLRSNEKICLDLQALAAGYPSAIKKILCQSPERLSILMANGQTIIYDDGRRKTPEEKLAQPDLEDMLSQPYPVGKPLSLPRPEQDPGRIRVEAFFQAVYGSTPTEVQTRLVAVPIGGTVVRFQGANGAAAALARVGGRLSQILTQKPALRAYLLPLQGTFHHRRIAGTERLSAHAWGIAIDLHKGSYWRWGKIFAPFELLAMQQTYPQEIVQAFEAEGFIWGGKWYHYDTMHFEYRPELLAKAHLTEKSDLSAGKR